MGKFTVNAKRYDPYRNFNFVIMIDNVAVAGLSKCSALKKTTEKVTWREGADASVQHQLPGKTSYDAITLTGGVTHDTTFEEWANKVNNFRGNPSMSLKGFRKNISIVVRNEADQPVVAYNVYNCWVSEYQALAELDAGGNAVLIQTIKLENEGWERDTAVTEPTET
jgi:phage tail-like protein